MKRQCVSTPLALLAASLRKKASEPSSAGQKHNSNFYFVSGSYSANTHNSSDCVVLWVLYGFG